MNFITDRLISSVQQSDDSFAINGGTVGETGVSPISGHSPNDVRKVMSASRSQSTSSSIKIAPNDWLSSIESKLNEYEALAEQKEYDMYYRIARSRNSSRNNSPGTSIVYAASKINSNRLKFCNDPSFDNQSRALEQKESVGLYPSSTNQSPMYPFAPDSLLAAISQQQHHAFGRQSSYLADDARCYVTSDTRGQAQPGINNKSSEASDDGVFELDM